MEGGVRGPEAPLAGPRQGQTWRTSLPPSPGDAHRKSCFLVSEPYMFFSRKAFQMFCRVLYCRYVGTKQHIVMLAHPASVCRLSSQFSPFRCAARRRGSFLCLHIVVFYFTRANNILRSSYVSIVNQSMASSESLSRARTHLLALKPLRRSGQAVGRLTLPWTSRWKRR